MDRDTKIILGAVGGALLLGAVAMAAGANPAGAAVQAMLEPAQEAHIKQLHPAVQNQFRAFIREVQEKTGWTVLIVTSYRTFQKSWQLKYDKSHPDYSSKNAEPGYSHHNYGMAIDVNLIKGARHIKKASPAAEWIATGVVAIAKKHGLRWGGEFKGYHDPVHFDAGTKYNTTVLLSMAKKQFGNDPAKIQGNQLKLAA